MIGRRLVETSRVGGWFQRALLFVLGPLAAAFVHLLLSPKREFAADRAAAAVRVTARARRRAAAARAGRRARRVPGSPATEPLYTSTLSRKRACRDLRHASAAGERIRRLRALDPDWSRRSCGRHEEKAAVGSGLGNNRRRPTLPGGCPPSTIGASGLNFSVRNGKRCTPAAMTAEIVKGARRRTLKTP